MRRDRARGHLTAPMEPPSSTSARRSLGAVALLIVSAGCLLGAPLAMPADYSWISHAVSESAAQSLERAWLARLGFLAFGWAVLWLAARSRPVWGRFATWMHGAFAVSMTATAAFSHKPWRDGVPVDLFEDALHSVAATVIGFSFTLGVLARFLRRPRGERARRAFDVVAMVAATGIPIAMLNLPEMDGLIQRVMFAISYAWYLVEALRSTPRAGIPP